MNKRRLVFVTIIFLMNLSIHIAAYSEPAPVYDADNMPQQFDETTSDEGQDLPPPPAPGQEGGIISNQEADAALPLPATRNLSIDQRIRRIEQQLNNMQNNELAVRVDSLQGQIQALRGQIEQLIHQFDIAQNQQKSMYAELDKRLTQNKAEPSGSTLGQMIVSNKTAAQTITKTTAAPTAAVVEVPPKNLSDQPNVAEEQQIYQTAYNFIKAKKYSDAVNTLQGMLKKYPKGQFASNAHYWLGELYGLMGKNDQALGEFKMVLASYPDSPRVSDAQLKVGLIFASQARWPDAKTAFKNVINRYPGTASSRLASEQLKQIKQAGH